MTNYAVSTPTGNYMQTNFGVVVSIDNTSWLCFNNTGGSGSSSNYLAMGMWGLAVGTSSFNACANGNFRRMHGHAIIYFRRDWVVQGYNQCHKWVGHDEELI